MEKKHCGSVCSRFTELFQKNNEGAWKLKEDWYDLDHLFLKKNPCFGAFLEYENAVGFTNTFMEEFAPDAFDNRREHISGFYREAHVTWSANILI